MGSRVRYMDLSIYALAPESLGRFHLVHAGDILLHLKRPLEGLRRLRDVVDADGQLMVSDVVDPTLPSRDGPAFMTRYLYGGIPTPGGNRRSMALGQMMIDADFARSTFTSCTCCPLAAGTRDRGVRCSGFCRDLHPRRRAFPIPG